MLCKQEQWNFSAAKWRYLFNLEKSYFVREQQEKEEKRIQEEREEKRRQLEEEKEKKR